MHCRLDKDLLHNQKQGSHHWVRCQCTTHYKGEGNIWIINNSRMWERKILDQMNNSQLLKYTFAIYS